MLFFLLINVKMPTVFGIMTETLHYPFALTLGFLGLHRRPMMNSLYPRHSEYNKKFFLGWSILKDSDKHLSLLVTYI